MPPTAVMAEPRQIAHEAMSYGTDEARAPLAVQRPSLLPLIEPANETAALYASGWPLRPPLAIVRTSVQHGHEHVSKRKEREDV